MIKFENSLDFLKNNGLDISKMAILKEGEKRPISSWSKKNYTRRELKYLYTKKHNFGKIVHKKEKYFVLDFDFKSGGLDLFEKYKPIFNNQGIVNTPGGKHVFCKLENTYNTISKKYTMKGLDIISTKSYHIIPPSYNKEKKGFYTYDSSFFTIPTYSIESLSELVLIDFIYVKSKIKKRQATKAMFLKALSYLDSDCDYDIWIRIGMALKLWDEKEGFPLWDDWSKSSDKYNKYEMKSKWDSFSNNKNSLVTANTIFFLASTSEKWKKEQDDNARVVMDNVKEIKKDKNMSKLTTYEKKARMYAEKAKEYKQKIKNKEEKHDNYITENIVKIAGLKGYYHIKSKKRIEASNINTFMTTRFYGKTFSRYVAENPNLIRGVYGLVFAPDKPNQQFLKIKNHLYLNSFNKSFLTKTASEISEKCLNGVEDIKKLLLLITGEEEYRDIFMEWIAYQVQYMGKPLNWAPFIQSVEGLGKGFIRNLLKWIIGHSLVKDITSKELTSQFTGWVDQDATVGVFDEINVKPFLKIEMQDSLKMIIGNEEITVNAKGKESYHIANKTSYILYTNRPETIDMLNIERRFWILLSQIKTNQEINEYIDIGKRTPKQFYNDLYHLEKYKEELRAYFLNYKISDTFLAYKEAPETRYKKAVQDTPLAFTTGAIEAKELLIKGSEWYNEKIIFTTFFFKDLEIENPNLKLNPYIKSKIIKALGFLKNDKPIKIDGVAYSFHLFRLKSHTRAEILNMIGRRDSK